MTLDQRQAAYYRLLDILAERLYKGEGIDSLIDKFEEPAAKLGVPIRKALKEAYSIVGDLELANRTHDVVYVNGVRTLVERRKYD